MPPFGIRFFVLFLLFMSTAHASQEYDRVYQLESLAWLKAADNVDGVFADYLDDAYSTYFKKQSRFLIKSLKNLDSVLGKSSLSYSQLIQNRDVLKKIAQKFKVESMIRTHVYKESDTYRFQLEWVYGPKGDVLAEQEFRYVDPRKDEGLSGSDLPIAIEHALDQLISKLPFLGQVTGVDGDQITVNLGRNQGVQARQIFVIYTLQNLKRHPILNTIEEWRWEAVGKAQVQQVEESLSFAKVIETEPNHTVIRYEKIKEILPAPPENLPLPTTAGTSNSPSQGETHSYPRIGWVAGNLGIGTYSRDVGLGTASTGGNGGGGLLENFALESHLWMNTRFLAEISFSESFFKYAPTDLATGNKLTTSYSGTSSQLRAAVGYSFFSTKTIFDPAAWVHAGYRSTSSNLANTGTDNVASSSIAGIFIGAGAEVPINFDFSAQLGLDLGIIKSASAPLLGFGDPTSTSDLMFSVGGIYHLQSQFFLRLQVKVNSQSMDFSAGQNLSQKTLSVSPSLMYYF